MWLSLFLLFLDSIINYHLVLAPLVELPLEREFWLLCELLFSEELRVVELLPAELLEFVLFCAGVRLVELPAELRVVSVWALLLRVWVPAELLASLLLGAASRVV